MTSVDRLIIFARYPEPGKAKTRLIPTLGEAGAAALYRQLAERTLAATQQLQFNRPMCVEVRFAGGDRRLMQRWLGTDLMYTVQGEGDLGDRMARSFQVALNAGVQQAILIGTDCPELDAALLEQAFAALENHDLVIGPATDGGYYLIGLRQFVPDLFLEMPWSTAEVLAKTIAIAERCGLSYALLPVLSDIDQPEDLPMWEQLQRS